MPNEVGKDFFLKALIYGQPGLGKSTLAISAPNPVLIDCDNGVHRIAASHRVPFLPVKSYEEVLAVINSNDIAQFETIVIDTAGKLLDYMSAYIIKENPKMGRKDGALTLQGYGVRKYEFINLLKMVSTKGKHLIFVAHEYEDKSNETKVVRAEVGGSSGGDLIKELDLVGYMEAIGKKRTISFAPCEKYYAKNSARMTDMLEIPTLTNGTANTFMTQIIDRCKAVFAEESEQANVYNNIITGLSEIISKVKDVKTANAALSEIGKAAHQWDSKMKAWTMLQAKAAELKLTFDKEGKKYVSPKSDAA
jgi:hypothetical protein